jgi:hypothetical protein
LDLLRRIAPGRVVQGNSAAVGNQAIYEFQ